MTRISPLVTGLVAGVSAAILQAVFRVSPPPAYGICIACHTRDLVNWIMNHAAGTTLGMAPVSKPFPVLTVVGIFIGALIASFAHGEFRIRKTHHPVVGFVLGFLVINFALFMGGCPIRTSLRTMYGDVVALLGLISIAVGVVLGAEFYLKRKT
ncbi:YeeE/YedE thiosulfate transporter family protein [Methanopyrus sp. KOL6]|uniref:YeeE/YedE thiosulfate transporter family protein n=1 Tax=Methanopyrus sp. KOL6 TaxID=1937004 RepID=UPI000B4A7C86|nr:YeeE/YedE thiosulfate transporter family protein [Methanopyrus sp. KOL6]